MNIFSQNYQHFSKFCLLKTIPQKALELALNDYFMVAFHSRVAMLTNQILVMMSKIAISGTTGVIVNTVIYPLDVIRTRLGNDIYKTTESSRTTSQSDLSHVLLSSDSSEVENQKEKPSHEKRYKNGVVSTGFKICKEDGITALYSGLMISSLGSFFYVGFKLGILDFINEIFYSDGGQDDKHKLDFEYIMAYAMTSWLTSSFAAFMTYPIETVRRRIGEF